MKIVLRLFILTIVITSCKSDFEKKHKDYKLIKEEGVFVEVFDSTNVKLTRFTDNNNVYRKKLEFIYSYKHITKNNSKYYFKEDPSIDGWRDSWKFVPADSIDENTILEVKIKIEEGLKTIIQYEPDYNQTVAQYSYLTKDELPAFNSISGIIENEKNVWMHPPRDKYFRILELNPFPYIQTPFEVDNKWNWSLKIDSDWGDKRWLTWKGVIENNYTYEITDKKKINTAFGKLECYTINATATSRLGETKLTSLFNTEYGFIKLLYTNIDGSKTKLQLDKVIKNEH
ncbi:hypothetical protein ATE84_4148 [Aquimarina sp. MAR_2010_214]|uniref:hypothetical protein n=1 Tax=Aquimarina sp. MAR_2010_214 TaxID=1250026 RepID=UPI000C709461|nr:hypothetical protein [Aquimarina sp. MAR_2010_214]PKV52047.1 hypothetical protein ATE84_4148 [Aquimarina sp. MAR_2010_214]